VRKSSRLESSQPRSERKVLPSRLRGASGLAPKDQTPPYEVRWGLASGGTVTEAIYEAGFNPSARFCAESTDMLDMRLSRYCDGCENEEINSPSGQRNWAPCRLRRPRSVAVTGRAAPRGDQICFPAKGPRALHPRPALESQSTDGTRFDSRQLPLLLPYGASRSRRRELLEIAVVRVQGAKARAVHSNAEHDLDDSGLVDDSWRHGQDGNFSVY
jgi:hypothetical protein